MGRKGGGRETIIVWKEEGAWKGKKEMGKGKERNEGLWKGGGRKC